MLGEKGTWGKYHVIKWSLDLQKFQDSEKFRAVSNFFAILNFLGCQRTILLYDTFGYWTERIFMDP